MKLATGIGLLILGDALGIGLKPYLGSMSTLVSFSISIIGAGLIGKAIWELINKN